MTRKEAERAIMALFRHSEDGMNDWVNGYNEAIENALVSIEALEQEPSCRNTRQVDLISRADLQELFNETTTSLMDKIEQKDIEHLVRACVMVTEMIQDAPSVVPKRGKWIPLNAIGGEPEEEGIYLLQLSDGFINSTYYDGKDWELWADAGEPVAWMPLPEPYRGGAEQ